MQPHTVLTLISSFGISKISEHPRHIRVRCGRLQYEYLASQPVHSSQELIQIDEDLFELKLHVFLTFELVQFLMGLGPAVEVIEPAELKGLITTQLEKTLKQYQ